MAYDTKRIAEDFCAAFGLDANDVLAIRFEWTSGQIGVIEVRLVVKPNVLEPIWRRYTLVPKDD